MRLACLLLLASGCVGAAPPMRTTLGVGGSVGDSESGEVAEPTREIRMAFQPLAMPKDTLDRPVDLGLGYFVQNPAQGRFRRLGPFLELGVHAWRRPWRKGVMRFSLHAYGELVARSAKRSEPWGGGVALAASLEAARWVRGAGGEARNMGLFAGAAQGEVGFGVELASGYRHLGDTDLWTTTLSFAVRTPGFLGLAVAGGLFR